MVIETQLPNYSISLTPIVEKVRRLQNKRNKLSSSPHLFEVPVNNIKVLTNSFGEQITRIDGEIPPNLTINEGQQFLFISRDQSSLTHGLHKYPAKFFPELPRWLIKRYSKVGEFILDPFCGSGTVNVEALLSHRHSVGIDIEPFSRFIAMVKTTPLDKNEVLTTQEKLLQQIQNYQPCYVDQNQIPEFPYRDHWFKPEILLELAFIKQRILELAPTTSVKNYFLTCFSSIIRSVSNADDNCTRTVVRKKLNKTVNPSDALYKFAETILTSTPRVIEFSSKCPPNISVSFPENMDARNIHFPDRTFDLALTSPPYVNAVDYPRTHQLESYWLGFVSGSLTPQKRKHIGTESVIQKEYSEYHEIGVREADEVMYRIYKTDKRRAYIAYKYLVDMLLNLKEVYRVLKPEGRYVIVVGNNQIRGTIFETWKYLMPLSQRAGFEVETYFASNIIKHFIKVPRSERINTDWIIVLKRPNVSS